jgi:Zn-dependent protease with chaperone function
LGWIVYDEHDLVNRGSTMPAYPNLSTEAIRHPLDYQAEQALRSVPGFDLVARKFMEFMQERPQRVYLMGNSVQVGPRQYSTLHRLFRENLTALDIHSEPLLFVVQNPEVNSYTLGEEQPYVVINTGLLDILTEEEIGVVLAHELGHLKCNHSMLTQMAIWTMTAASWVGELTMGIGNIMSSGLIYAFYEWRRKAELSADRAAMLATDDFARVMQTMVKVSGGSRQFAHELNLDEFERQADEYKALDQDDLNQIYKFLMVSGLTGMMQSHPFPVERVHYLKQWANSEEYARYKAGDYPRATREGAIPVEETVPSTGFSELDQLQRGFQDLQSQWDQLWRRL